MLNQGLIQDFLNLALVLDVKTFSAVNPTIISASESTESDLGSEQSQIVDLRESHMRSGASILYEFFANPALLAIGGVRPLIVEKMTIHFWYELVTLISILITWLKLFSDVKRW